MTFLVYTNVISEFAKDAPDAHVRRWIETTAEDDLFVSAMTIAELRRGVALLPEGRRKRQLDVWLTSELLPRFSERIISVDARVADRWGEMAGTLKRQDAARHAMDAFIAATASVHTLVVASRNERDFEQFGVAVVNPFKPS